MFVYLDETEFGDGKFSGYACLITPTRIERRVIDEALKNLRDDPDRHHPVQKPMDDRTLLRSFFHAADDSKNAHSHLCRSICKHVKGDYQSHVFHTDKHSFNSLEDLYNLASKLAVVGLFSKCAELTFIFERRGGLNVAALLSKWWPDLCFDIARNAYVSPFIVKYYPKVTFEVSDKSEPGLQVVDFMLWAAQKARMDDRSEWFARLPGWSKSKISTVEGGWEGESIRMLEPKPNHRYDSMHCNFDDPKFSSFEILHQFIVNAQAVINKSYYLSGRARVEHFYSDIESLYARRDVIQPPAHIKEMAVCFIRLFDNIEVINTDTPPEDKTFWLAARKCFALVLHEGVEAWAHTLRLSDVRNMLIEQQPHYFSIGIDDDSTAN